ncbi:hypothetical protein PV328_002941 [Microctonus aethiopoides]|uniref:Uncharacterized protein n=1 Tax=Microctonus aethiopoides TaxID=144406 RepID=A0AA39F7D2_9HYME|nr:hypothetical protein PV328_002941 [Microctonus aethiopoides]
MTIWRRHPCSRRRRDATMLGVHTRSHPEGEYITSQYIQHVIHYLLHPITFSFPSSTIKQINQSKYKKENNSINNQTNNLQYQQENKTSCVNCIYNPIIQSAV